MTSETKNIFDFHPFDPENYEKEVYEILTFDRKIIPGYPNAGIMNNLKDGSIIPKERIYLIRVAKDIVDGVEPTYSDS